MKVSVLGLGYIGLPTAALISSKKINVEGIDLQKSIINRVKKGKIHIVEKGLEKLVKKSVQDGFLTADIVLKRSDVFIIAVPTPVKKNNDPDLSYIFKAIKDISKVLEKGNLIIIESTIPVGTTQKLAEEMKKLRPDLKSPYLGSKNGDFSLSYCPERVLPGNILKELVLNDRVVGGINDFSSKSAKKFYKLFVKGNCHLTDCRTAELCKLIENSSRDLNIAFANELSLISDELEINVWDLIKLANYHPRVNILNPGPGVGGHCIAVDPWFVINSAPSQSKIIKKARNINDDMPNQIIKKIKKIALKDNLNIKEIEIACLGLSFKADVDDLRESPAIEGIKKIKYLNPKKINVVEPNIRKLPEKQKISFVKLVSLKKAIQDSKLIIVLVDHKEFKKINFKDFKDKVVIDVKGIFN
mgnify:FL=1